LNPDTLEMPHWLARRIWRHAGQRERVTRGGRKVIVEVWEGECCICGRPFEIGAMSPASKNFQKVSCPSHRFTAQEALRIGRKSGWRRRKCFERIKERKLMHG
jgi:hypothetical protein